MANRRMINSDMFEDENFITFDDVTRLVWIGLITKCADDQGRLQDNVLLIKAQLFPADKKTASRIGQSVEALVKSGMLSRYEKEGKTLLQINNWWKHQTPSWASSSNYPAPDYWVDKEKYHSKGKTIVSNNWDQPGGYVDNPGADDTQLHSGYVATTLELHSQDVNGDVKGDDEISTTATAREEISEIVKAYESEVGILTGMIREKLVGALEEYPKDWIVKALEECASKNKRNWSYAEAILKRWKVEGFQTDSRQRVSNPGYKKQTDRRPDIPGYVSDRSNEVVVYD